MPAGSSMVELAALVDGALTEGAATPITDVTHRSDQATEGSLFVALKGATVDGHDFVPDAIQHGASGIVVSQPVAADLPTIVVGDTRAALAPLSAAVHGHPSHDVPVVGVTGTNGKTTVTHFIHSMSTFMGWRAGLIGTINVKIEEQTIVTDFTTPEAPDFQRLLSEMRDREIVVVAAEVSSHALEFGRVGETRFKVAAFTNLSQDHLDFHGSMQSYAEAKKKLFTQYSVETAVVNIDDPVGAEIAGEFTGNVVSVGLEGDVSFSDLEAVPGGTRFRFTSPWGSETVSAPVVGEFNVANLAMAAACCLSLGAEFSDAVAAMANVAQVPGRYEVISGDDPIQVVVDYAHTPEGVARAVETARTTSSGRIIALVGAGGDRDREKRPMMGEALATADVAVVTSDNPRSEDPDTIVEAVAAGVPDAKLVVEVDRRAAIDRALREARDGDVVLVLGRGHEPFQTLSQGKVPFDDRLVAGELLAAVRKEEATTLGGVAE